MADRRTVALLVATLISAGAIASVAMGGDDRSREAAVAKRGAKVMPFSLKATTHVFEATPAGGTQRVVADDSGDGEEIRLVREDLREEAVAFERGDFADPGAVHGTDMPGLATLQSGFDRIRVTYRDLPDGAEIAYRTADRSLAVAVGDWFEAQLRDHGGDARPGGDALKSDHASHHG